MKKILYIPGYGGSSTGETATMLKEIFSNCEVTSIDLDFNNPQKAFDDYWNAGIFDYVIASSYGAFFAGMVVGNGIKILVNPAFPEDVMRLDPNYSCPRAQELKEICYHYSDNELNCETYIIFGNKDEVVNNKEFFENKFRKNHIYNFDMGHKLSRECAESIIKTLIGEGSENN